MFIDLLTGALDDLYGIGTESSRKILYETIDNLLVEHRNLARTNFEQNARSNINLDYNKAVNKLIVESYRRFQDEMQQWFLGEQQQTLLDIITRYT